MASNLRPAYLSFLYSMLASHEHTAVDSAPPLDLANIPEANRFMERKYHKFCKRNHRVARGRIAYIKTVKRTRRDPAVMKAFTERQHQHLRAYLTIVLQYVTWYLCFDRTQPGNYQ